MMFEQMKNLASIMKNAGAIRERVEKFKAEMERLTVEGESGGGAVRVMLNGKSRCLRVDIDQPLMAGLAGDDKTMVEELISAAFNDAHDKLQRLVQEEIRKAAGGLDLPGLEGMLGQ
jgi:nucleoid-associated protein EbfC